MILVYGWTEEDAKRALNRIWNDPEAWDRGERSWHSENENWPSGFFSPNASGDAFAFITIKLKEQS